MQDTIASRRLDSGSPVAALVKTPKLRMSNIAISRPAILHRGRYGGGVHA